MYGASHGYVPVYIINAHWLHWLHGHQLRRAGNIFALPTALPLTSLGHGRGWAIVHSRGDRALSVAGPLAWNALSADIRCALSLDTFKKRLKSHLFLLFTSYNNLFYL